MTSHVSVVHSHRVTRALLLLTAGYYGATRARNETGTRQRNVRPIDDVRRLSGTTSEDYVRRRDADETTSWPEGEFFPIRSM